MKKVIVYSGPNCPYCQQAKKLLEHKGVAFEEYNVRADPGKLEEMMQKSGGRRTIPQIFIGDRHVGGYDDLHALNAAGGLDEILA